MNTLAITEDYNESQIILIKNVYAKGATDDEFKLFIELARRKGLDIFSRQIHFVKRWDPKKNGYVGEVQTGIDGYRLIAERTGLYEGQVGPFWCGLDGEWKDVWLGQEPPAAAKIGVWRKKCREPFWGIAIYSEYVQLRKNDVGEYIPNAMWKKMAANQLAKCAEALALRRAFPSDLGGIYTSEEMGQASNPIIEIEKEIKSVTPAKEVKAIIAAPKNENALSKEQFKQICESGSGEITNDMIAECAIDWGIYDTPRTKSMDLVVYKVLAAANVSEAEDYNPDPAATDEQLDELKQILEGIKNQNVPLNLIKDAVKNIAGNKLNDDLSLTCSTNDAVVLIERLGEKLQKLRKKAAEEAEAVATRMLNREEEEEEEQEGPSF